MEKLSIDRVVEVESIEFEDNESSLRPSVWEEYIGQESIKKNLQVFIEAARLRNDCLDHILFFGPPGLGKTTISHIIAHQMGANIKVSAAPMIEKSGDLAEIHRLSPAIEEILYPAMEDFRLDIIIGSGPAAQTLKIDLPRFTLIGATTRAGMLSNPLRDRFGMNFRMEFYSIDELDKIVQMASAKLNTHIDAPASKEIAKRSRGTPRIALRLLRRVRDYAQVAKEQSITAKRAHYALEQLGVNDLGFDSLDLRYLELLAENRGKPMGLNALSAALSEDQGTIEDVIEPYLLANGYVERTARGRIATHKTYELLKFPQPNTLF